MLIVIENKISWKELSDKYISETIYYDESPSKEKLEDGKTRLTYREQINIKKNTYWYHPKWIGIEDSDNKGIWTYPKIGEELKKVN